MSNPEKSAYHAPRISTSLCSHVDMCLTMNDIYMMWGKAYFTHKIYQELIYEAINKYY